MPFIPDDVLETIRARADITEVVQSYVPTLKKMGATWKACCPFHQEKTPSFTVNPQRGIYKCFGCGKGGNVFSFIMEMEKLDFPNAAQMLARKYGIVIPDTEPGYGRRKNHHSAPDASYDVRERLYQLHEKLAAWYVKQLWDHPESPVAKYFKTRLIPQETAVRFQIGAAPDSWDAAIQFAHSQNFTDEELKLSGIVSSKDDHSGHIYDRFRNRLIFPIRNEHGRVIAFSARSIDANPQGWKYINSPETPVFKKSRTLYALDFARKPIDEKKSVVLCEGQLDVIAMHRAGCTNAVAPQGTAFGEEQATILKRYTNTVFLALDNDKAGQTAVFKDAAILLPMGFHLKTAVYPKEIKDSDEFLKKQGADALRTAVENSIDFFDFAFHYLSAEVDLTAPAGKSAVAVGLAKYLFLIDDPVTLDAYTSWLAEKLQLDKQAFMLLLERHKQQEAEQKAKAAYYASLNKKNDSVPIQKNTADTIRKQLSEIHPGAGKAYYELLALLLEQEEFAARAGNDLQREYLDKTPAGRSVELVIQAEMNGEWEDAQAQIVMMMTKDGITDPRLSALVMTEPENKVKSQLDEDTYRSCLSTIRQAWRTERKKELIAHAMALPDNSEEKMNLLQEIASLNNKLFQRNS